MSIALACCGLLGILLFGLGLAVSLTRIKMRRGFGAPDDPKDPMTRLIRAHANTAEFAPMMAVMILVLGFSAPSRIVELMMIGGTLSRWLLAAGLLIGPSLRRPSTLRQIGATGTYVFGLALAVAIILEALERIG